MSQLRNSFRQLRRMLPVVAVSCASNPSTAPEKPAPTSAQTRQSARFGYSWTLPKEWEFIPPKPDVSGIEVTAARKKGRASPETMVLVGDLVTVVPGRVWEPGPGDDDYGTALLRKAGVEVLGSRRVRMLGVEAVEVNGGAGE